MVMVANRGGIEAGYLAGRYPGSVGHLYSPGHERGPYAFMPYALDNGAFVAWSAKTAWQPEPWRRLLMWAAMSGQAPLWSLVPDVVADREGTLKAWKIYSPEVKRFGFRTALAVQDGMSFEDVPDDECVLFLGGSTEWKEAAIGPWCARFPGRVHVGRVNTWGRLVACYRARAVSVDGTGWFRKGVRGERHRSADAGSSQAADLLKFFAEIRGERIAGVRAEGRAA